MSITPFAKIYSVDGEQILCEVVPSRDPEKMNQGIPDIVLSTNLGWSYYSARVQFNISEEGKKNVDNLFVYMLDSFTEEKARKQLQSIKADFGAQAIVDKMVAEGKYDLVEDAEEINELLSIEISDFAKIIEVGGRQVLAVLSEELGEDNEQPGLVIKTALEGGNVSIRQMEGLTLDDFTPQLAQECVEQIVGQKPVKRAKP